MAPVGLPRGMPSTGTREWAPSGSRLTTEESSYLMLTCKLDRSKSTAMRIERIETIPIRIPLKTLYSGSNYSMSSRCTIITRVYTSDGIVGECYNGDEDDTMAAIKKIVDDEIAPTLVGQDVFNTERCWEIAQQPTRNILRERKLATQAQACVDSALHDALGKA